VVGIVAKSGALSSRAYLAILAAAMLSVWSGTALSASWSSQDCQQATDNPCSVDSIAELTAKPVDHVTIEPRLSDADHAPLTPAAAEEHHTPLLYLSPRVASVLRDIFGDAEAVEPQNEDLPSSTLAEIESKTEFEEGTDPGSGQPEVEEAPSLPLYQRQMYRIDI
jgi:hypothetical protein